MDNISDITLTLYGFSFYSDSYLDMTDTKYSPE